MFSRENAEAEVTDSGAEDNVSIDNSPGSQLRAPIEVTFQSANKDNFDSDKDSDFDLFLFKVKKGIFQKEIKEIKNLKN